MTKDNSFTKVALTRLLKLIVDEAGDDEDLLEETEFTLSDPNRVECPLCHKFYNSHRNLIRHQKVVHRAQYYKDRQIGNRSRPLSCQKCHIQFVHQFFKDIHNCRVNPEDLKFICTCGARFFSGDRLEFHRFFHGSTVDVESHVKRSHRN